MFNFNISIVVPVMNEAPSLKELVSEVEKAISGRVSGWEFVFVNDFSTDSTEKILKELSEKNPNVRYVNNPENLGQGYSLIIGMKAARYETIVTMDGDLQIEPMDIEKMLFIRVFKNLDFVCSRRMKRAEEKFKRHIPSILGNILISTMFNCDFHDIGSSLKIVPKKHVKDLEPFRNIHRYLSIILSKKGLNFEEVPISDRYRKHGESHYNFTKFLRVFYEIAFLKSYLRRNIK